MAKVHQILLGAFLLLYAIAVSGQQPTFLHYDVNDGLASSVVHSVMQDSKGYIWFGTESGISRFDGYKFKTFTTSDGLPDNEVFTMHEDSTGRIWIFAYNGKGCYYKNGRIFNAEQDTLLQHIQTKGYFTQLLQDSHHNLWFVSSGGEIICLRPDETVTRYDRSASIAKSGRIKLIMENDRGEIIMINVRSWNKVNEKKAHVFLDQDGQPFIFNNSFPRNQQIGPKRFAIAEYTGLYVMKWQDTAFAVENKVVLDGIPLFNSPVQGPGFFVGTSKGAFYFDSKDKLTHYKVHVLKDKPINYIMRDNEGNLWFTTPGWGVYFTASVQIVNYDKSDGLADNFVYSVNGDQKGKIWLGIQDGLFYAIDKGKVVNYFPDRKEVQYKNRILKILFHPDGSKYFLADSKVYVMRGTKIQEFSMGGKAITVGSEGKVYIATIRGVLVTANDQNLNEPFYRLPEDQFIYNGRAHALHNSKKHGLLIGSKAGLKQYINNTLQEFPVQHKILEKNITDIVEYTNGQLVVATSGWGIGVINGDEVQVINDTLGLSSNQVKSLFLDEKEQLWIATNNGLNLLVKDAKQPTGFANTVFTANDGLASNQINDIFVKGDSVWVATSLGLTVFNAKTLTRSYPAPILHLIQLRANHKTYAPETPIELLHTDNDLLIEYIGLSYKYKGKVTYRYKLLPVDTTWSYTTNTQIEFPSMSSGEYQFLLNAANVNGQWLEYPISLQFQILPPYWQTWWFRTVVALLLLGLIGLIVWFLNKRTRLEEQRKAAFREQLAESEQKALRAQMNPHFIFNSLNSIQQFIASKDEEAALSYLTKFGRLIRMVLDHSKHGSVPIEDELQALTIYLDLEALRVDHQFDYTFNIDPSVDTFNIEIPPLLLQPYVENAIWHGIMPKRAHGSILITLKREGDNLLCLIEDDGIGREQAMAIKAQKKYNHQSVGMLNTQERIDLLYEKQGKHSTRVEVVDLKDDQGNASGTKVILRIPIDL